MRIRDRRKIGITWEYLAGFTDGEGHIGVIGRHIRLTLGQKNKRQLLVIKTFLEDQGLRTCLYYRPRKHSGLQKRGGIWALMIQRRKDVVIVLNQLQPFLVLKYLACQKALEWHEANPVLRNVEPVDINEFRRLVGEGYARPGIARLLKISVSTVSSTNKVSPTRTHQGTPARVGL